MYLNFDKTAVGIFIYLFFLKTMDQKLFEWSDFYLALKTLGLLVVAMMPLALATHYVTSVPVNLVAFKILGLRQQLMVMDRMTALDF